MQAHNSTIEEFLGTSRTIFVVPVYQRNYDWLDNNCLQLFQDVIRTVSNDKEHFLGTICFKNTTSHEKSIIDGQQRLTTITLMLRALQEVTENEDLKLEISEDFLFNKGHSIDNDYLKVKLHLNERDDEVYRVILNNTFSMAKDKLDSLQRESRVFQNYKLFIKLIGDYISRKGDPVDIVKSLEKLTIIELEIQQENPQEIFESLNSTGLDLTNVDLLRNYLLMQFGHFDQTKLYKDYWSKIEDYVGVINMEAFFVDYLIFKKRTDAIQISGRRSHVNESNLYIAFKDYYTNYPEDDLLEKTRLIFSDMKDYAEVYSQMIFKPDVNIEKETPLRRKLYSLLEVTEATKSRALILDLLTKKKEGKISDDDLDTAVTAISSYCFRSRVCLGKSINRQFAGNVLIRIDQFENFDNFKSKFWSAMTFGKGTSAFPNDKDFKDALATKDMYLTLRSRGTKYLLYTLEENSPFPKGLPAFEDETISIEHVMPQTLNAKWKTYLGPKEAEEAPLVLHHLGNLTLTSYNSEMSNKSFDEKKTLYYESSNFHYTRELTKVKKWSLSEIDTRGKTLAEIAVKVWPLPEEYQIASASKETLHLLDEDFSQFTYSKLVKLYIDDSEFEINSWAEFILSLCSKLMSINEDAFRQIANPNLIKAFVRAEDENDFDSENYLHIIDDIYLGRKKNAYNMLVLAEKIVREFDAAAKTDMFNSIIFETK